MTTFWLSKLNRTIILLESAEVVGSGGGFTGADEVGYGFLGIERQLKAHGSATDWQNQVDALPIHRIQVVSTTAHDSGYRLAISLGATRHAHRCLTGGGLLVHIALACNDQVDITHALIKPHEIEHRLNARTQLRPERQQRGTQPPAAPAPGTPSTEPNVRAPSGTRNNP